MVWPCDSDGIVQNCEDISFAFGGGHRDEVYNDRWAIISLAFCTCNAANDESFHVVLLGFPPVNGKMFAHMGDTRVACAVISLVEISDMDFVWYSQFECILTLPGHHDGGASFRIIMIKMLLNECSNPITGLQRVGVKCFALINRLDVLMILENMSMDT